jgi:hypothetical protein
MMAEKTRRPRPILIILLAMIALIALAALLWFLQTRRLEAARNRFHPPQVHVSNPVQGQQEIAGTHMFVAASAMGFTPLASLDLWVDGYLVETYPVDDTEGSEVIYSNFSVPVFEGVHMLVVRATDIEGLVGRSLPVGYEGVRRPDADFYLLSQPYNPAIPFDELVESLGGDPGMAVDFNPGVAAGECPPGAPLEIPVVPEPEPGVPQPAPDGQLGQNGLATGNICYPSQYIPAMTAYFKEVNTGAVTSLPIAENQLTYQIDLPQGTYHAYAWLPDKSLGGHYSYAVPCGLDVSCTDHNPLPFYVYAGLTTTGIDICDWYSESDVPQAPGAAAPASPATSGDVEILDVGSLFPAGNRFSLPFAITIPSAAPPAPTDFSAAVENCQVKLSWKSSGSMAANYAVWMADQSGLQKLIATLKPGSGNQLGYSFQPPKSGVITVWVEAYNALGSQSSAPAQVKVDTTCASEESTDIRIESQVISVPPEYQQVYVYLSIDGYPERRFTSDDSSFLIAEGGRVSMPPEARESGVYVIPQPSDGSIELSAECWGWAGGQLSQISMFSEVLTSSDWNAGPLNVGNERCGLSLLVNTSGDGQEYSTFSGNGLTIPAPFNVREVRIGDDSSLDLYEQWIWFWQRQIRWQWKGDIKTITGFTINLNGKPIATVPAYERRWTVTLPEWCGVGNNWTVTANGKTGNSPTSAAAYAVLPYCPAYIVIGFADLQMYSTCEGFCAKGSWPCDKLEAYYKLGVGTNIRNFYGGNFFYPLDCGYYYIPNMHEGSKSTVFVKPIPANNKPMSYRVLAEWWDYDTWSANDLIFRLDATWGITSVQQAKQAVASCSGSSAKGSYHPLYWTASSLDSSLMSSYPGIGHPCAFYSSLRKTDSGKGDIVVWWFVYEPSASGK